MHAMEKLFSYGSLQRSDVQVAVFGRTVDTHTDVLVGYRVVPIRLTDARTIELTETADHSILEKTSSPTDHVAGALLLVTEDDLILSDAFEPPEYHRVRAQLLSGGSAWVYVRG